MLSFAWSLLAGQRQKLLLEDIVKVNISQHEILKILSSAETKCANIFKDIWIIFMS